MITATLERGGTTVDLPLLDQAANILLAVDHGKPELITHENGGSQFPRVQDRWSGQQNFNILGKYTTSTAYQDAINLVELIQEDGDGDPLILNVPGLDELSSDIKVVPSAEQARALNLSYSPGQKNIVDFDLGLTRVDRVNGGYDRTITTPTATGTGPIELRGPAGSVEFVVDVDVQRYTGRPNDVVRRNQSNYPNYYPKPKALNDEFELRLLYTDNATGKTEQLADLFRTRLGSDGLTLDFNGIYGYGEFTVMPNGQGALRHVRDAGKEGVIITPVVSLQRITT
jgi:hypothetical protein